MRIMLDDPVVMTPLQRRSEIAAILARGVLRLRESSSKSNCSSDEFKTCEKARNSGQTCLDCVQKEALMDEPVNGTGERNDDLCPCP